MHATVAVLTALGIWNDVMTPLVIMSGTGKNTLPLAQLNFQTQFGTNYNLAFASYLLALLPILIWQAVKQKKFAAWMTILLTILTQIPYFCSVLNFFSYPSGRWYCILIFFLRMGLYGCTGSGSAKASEN